MQIPNLLNIALRAVGTQEYKYLKYLSRMTNEAGLDVAVYDVPKPFRGQVQPVPRNLYQTYGLDFQKNYLTFYVSKDILDVGRDVAGDQVQFAGNMYKCESKTDWFDMNGWVGVIASQIIS